MDATERFEEHRRLLFGIAYRMLSSVVEAEDVVQDVYLQWLGVDHETVTSPRAYLTTMVSRLSIDRLRSARLTRESYIGPWLPEPLISGPTDEPDHIMVRSEAVSVAFMVMMEELSPEQRAAFLLHDVFDIEYATVAAILDTSEANSRQLTSRARRALRAAPHEQPSWSEQMEVAHAFWSALQEGDVSGVLETLADDAVWWSDGGGKVHAAKRPIRGATAIVHFLSGLMRLAPDDLEFQWTALNNGIGLIFVAGGKPVNVVSLDIRDGRIHTFYAIVNPDKLGRLRVGD